MTYDLFLGFTIFAIVSSITPGPNNLMLMASGANFGLRRTIPHMLGVGLGFAFMIVLMGFGLAGLFAIYPMLHSVLKVVSVIYLIWLAWKIASAAPEVGKAKMTGKPFTFLQAAAFQWVNPKAWTMSITALTVYLPEGSGLWGGLLIAGAYLIANLPCITIWAWMGVQMRRFLNTSTRLRAFNITMAVLLVASLYPIFL